MKKLWLFVVLALCFALPCMAEEAPAVYTCGEYSYVLLEDGTAEIVGYSGEEAKVTVPSELDGYCVTSLGNGAFFWSNDLQSVTIPDSVLHIDSNPFLICNALTQIKVSPDHPVFASVDGVLFNHVTDTLICYPTGLTAMEYAVPQGTQSIGSEAFYSCQDLTVISLPDTLLHIGSSAFFGCNQLTSIAIPDSVETISDNPFDVCRRLTDIQVSPDSVALATIDGVLFDKTTKTLICYPYSKEAEHYSVPQGIQHIGASAFRSCDQLKSVTIPDSVKSIGSRAFENCGLLSISLPDGITSINTSSFWGCSKLESIAIPDSVTSIGYSAFGYCYSLKEITIPDGVTSIGANAFERCSSLSSITLPDSVSVVDGNPFADCENLTRVVVSPDHPVLATIDGVLFDKTTKTLLCYPRAFAATEYAIPQGIQHIADKAFYECTSLTGISIPQGVTTIGNEAFARCTKLTDIILPDSITSMGYSVFNFCSGLKTITVPRNSYAAQYCKENDLPYTYPDANDWLLN